MNRWLYRLLSAGISRMPARYLETLSGNDALSAFRHAAKHSSAYRTLLDEHGVQPGQIRSQADFTARLPVLTKANTFSRFPLTELCTRPLTDRSVASVLTSSGQGGRFAYGITTRDSVRRSAALIDIGLHQAFQIFHRRTLLINCLPMGVGFASDTVTIAETSVREDMVVALAGTFGPHYEQIILVADPLFMKRVADHAREKGFDWRQHRVHVVLGEETFGEHYRDYLAACLGNDPDALTSGFIGSSMGVGELGLNLFFETRRSVALRRLARQDRDVRELLFGRQPEGVLPVIFAYNPVRTFIEVIDAGPNGFGRLLTTPLGRQMLPLPRYDSGDHARLIPPSTIAEIQRMGHRLPEEMANLPLIALSGRDKDHLPFGLHVSQFKEWLYADPLIADGLSGAFRLQRNDDHLLWHVQAARGVADPGALTASLSRFPASVTAPVQVRVWPYREYPYAMGLDYERKLVYWEELPANATQP